MAIKRRPAFDPKAFLAVGGEGRIIGRYRQGQIVYSEGEPAESVFYIQDGKVMAAVVSKQGKEAVVAFFGPNEFFGESCLAGQAQRTRTVVATMESVIVRLETATIRRLIREETAFSEMFIANLLRRRLRIEADLLDQLFNSSERRLARLLLLLSNHGGEGEPEPVIGKISQETLAKMIGATRSRVNFFMNKFRKQGFIEYKDHIEVHSSLLNAILHDDLRVAKLSRPDIAGDEQAGVVEAWTDLKPPTI